jgi:hypothetical protein
MPAPYLNFSPASDLWLPGSYAASEEENTPGSPRWWLKRLCAELDERWSNMRLYDDYYEGRHRIAYATAKFREAFGSLFSAFSDNWCPIVIDASVERLVVEGFRFGGDKADTRAWDIWQANDLDAESVMAHTEAVKLGEAAVIVDVPDVEGGLPRITVEHPSQVVIANAAGSRQKRAAAMKRWVDDDGYGMATVYLPGAAYKFRTAQPLKSGRQVRWVERPREAFETLNPVPGVVPVVPLRNNPSMLHGGRSDLQVGIPIQDAINKECNDMLVASEFAAYRQRIMTGVEVPTDPVTGHPQKIDLSAGRMFTVADPDAKVYDLAASDLGNYTKAIEMFVQHLAAQTRTPPHYLMGQVVNASGDALKAAEAGLVARTKRKTIDFSDSWEEAMRLAFAIADDRQRAETMSAETIWREVENRSQAEVVDAAVKKRTLAVPLETLWADMGYSPQQIADMKTLAGLPDRPAPGATTAQVPPILGGPDAPASTQP